MSGLRGFYFFYKSFYEWEVHFLPPFPPHTLEEMRRLTKRNTGQAGVLSAVGWMKMTYSKNSKLNDALIRLSAAKSRDESDSRLEELYPIAIENLEEFTRVYFERNYNPFPLVWIMQGVQQELAFKILKDAIKSKDQYVRWAAAEGLAKSQKEERIELLILCLKDRSHLVKGVAVTAMKNIRDKRAVPHLKHIVSQQSMQKNALGIVKDAMYAIEIIEE